jgi:two-component system chemotaxis response regulator CheB
VALQRIPQLSPDVVTLDIEMPEMDGLEMLRRARGAYPQVRFIMFSTLTERGAALTLEALTLGADDYVTKASNEGALDRSLARLRDELVPKIRQFFRLGTSPAAPHGPAPPPLPGGAPLSHVSPAFSTMPRALAIGVSTGGPAALNVLLPELPADFPLPVLVVQHMPPLFTRFLAEQLDSRCGLQVREAADGDAVKPGSVLIAPGDFHMKLVKEGACIRVRLDQSPPQNSCRPSVDALFRSVGEVYDGAAIAVVLTGMGQDGLRGSEMLKARGATVLAQDEASSVVWGMPGAVASGGVADRVLPLDRICPEILRLSGAVRR